MVHRLSSGPQSGREGQNNDDRHGDGQEDASEDRFPHGLDGPLPFELGHPGRLLALKYQVVAFELCVLGWRITFAGPYGDLASAALIFQELRTDIGHQNISHRTKATTATMTR